MWSGLSQERASVSFLEWPSLPFQPGSALLATVLKSFPKLLRGSFLFHSVAQSLVRLQLHLKASSTNKAITLNMPQRLHLQNGGIAQPF